MNWGGDIPFVTPPDLRPVVGGVVGPTERTLTRAGAADGSAVVPAGSVILSIRAPIGYAARTSGTAAFNQGCRALVPNEDNDARFLCYALIAAGPELESIGRGTTFVELSATQMAAFEIPVWSIDQQRAIADYLDRETAQIDTLVAEQERLIALLRERRHAIVSKLLHAAPHWAESRIKNIAETTLGKMLDAGRDVREGDELKPYVRAADVLANGTVNLNDLNQMPFSSEEASRLDLCAGDVLLIEGGATVGRPGMLATGAPGVSFQKTVNRVRTLDAEPRFVYWQLKHLYDTGYYDTYYGSVSFAHLTAEKLREVRISLPSRDEQVRIAVTLDQRSARIDELITETERFIALSRERRTALITAAVTGQIDVREGAS